MELAVVGGPRVRAQVRLQREHPSQGALGGAVPAELDLSVDEGGVGRHQCGLEGMCPPGQLQSACEVVARERQCRLPRESLHLRRVVAESLRVGLIGPRVVGRVGGLPGALVIGAPELGGQMGVGGIRREGILQDLHLGLGIAEGQGGKVGCGVGPGRLRRTVQRGKD